MLQIDNIHFNNRLLLGTAQYPTLSLMLDAIVESHAEIITISLQRESYQQSHNPFWDVIKSSHCRLLPNTAGCRNAEDAITMAEMAREIFATHWIKLEVIGDEYHLQPDPFELLKAAKILIQKGFIVFPFCTDDLVLCQRLVDVGCEILMPWAAPIGTGKGILNPYALQTIRARLPHTTIIVDAGIGKPSHAAFAMELGVDAILLNSAVALALQPIKMAGAFRDAVKAGRSAFEAGMMHERNLANSSTLLLDTPFWHQEKST
jgi:thiazole synthase